MDNAHARTALQLAEQCHDDDVALNILTGYDKVEDKITNPIYSHISCMSHYLEVPSTQSSELYKKYVDPLIEDLIQNNYCIKVTEIKQVLTDANPTLTFYNHLIKRYIVQEFGKRITFCNQHRKNESQVIYPSHITPGDIVARLQEMDNLKSAAKTVRNDLLTKTDFGLSGKLCDKHDLEEAWKKSAMTENIATFLSALLDVRKTDLLMECHNDRTNDIIIDEEQPDDAQEDEKFRKRKNLVA